MTRADLARLADLDKRLASLAPATSPDPERLHAARATLDAALEGADGARSRRVGGAHVLDLGGVQHEHEDGHDVGHDVGNVTEDADLDVVTPVSTDDVVVPLHRGRTARERRRRRVQLGAAAAGVVGVVAVGLALSPWRPAPSPAAPPSSACAARLTTAADQTEDVGEAVTWRALADESRDDGTRLALMRSDDGGLTGFCAETGAAGSSTVSTTLWPDDPDTDPGADEVVPAGVRDDDWYVAWGSAGADVRSVALQAEWPSEDRSDDGGLVVDARRVGDGEWAVLLRGDEVPPEAEVSLRWHLADGSERSTPLEGAWPADPTTVTPPAEARRDACAGGHSTTGVMPVIEQRDGDVGITVLARDRERFVVCQQDAEPPYAAWNTVSGEIDDLPARDEATPLIGGGSGDARVIVGLAGDDVARAQLWVPGGPQLDAVLSDGYWAAWGTGIGEEQWNDARLVWYLDDGSRHESPARP